MLCAYTPTLHQPVARPPHSQAWCCSPALTSGLRWPSGANLNGIGVNSSPDGRNWDSPKERWRVAAQSLHSDFNSTWMCVQNLLQHHWAKHLRQNQSSLPSTTLTKTPPRFHLLKHIDNLDHVTFLLGLVFWGLLSTSANRWHQLSKCSVKEILYIQGRNCISGKEIAYPFLPFWSTSLPIQTDLAHVRWGLGQFDTSLCSAP